MYIVGAGLAGLIAAHKFPNATVVEKGGRKESHTALLRFRTDAISKITGIPFKKVTVRKGIYHDGEFVAPNIRLANQYSMKVLGEVSGDRSIWNTESCTRYIAPHDFYNRLVDNVNERIEWNSDFDLGVKIDRPVISTAPLPVAAKAAGIGLEDDFKAEPIYAYRYRLKGVRNVYQTIYYPDNFGPDVYRASITDGVLIIEAKSTIREFCVSYVLESFGLKGVNWTLIDGGEQPLGKISPIDNEHRRAAIHALTDQNNIFSLGRFATWRNILLDDLVQDMELIEQLIKNETYRRKLLRK